MDTSQRAHGDTNDCIRALRAEVNQLKTALKTIEDRRRHEEKPRQKHRSA
jgi:hypothetical protein